MHRSEKLARMGFKSYDAYLRSSIWAAIRQRVLDRDNSTCSVCNRDAECVHHTKYDDATMDGRSITALVSLCEACHRAIEFNEHGNKTALNEANRRLHNLRKSFKTIQKIKAKLLTRRFVPMRRVCTAKK